MMENKSTGQQVATDAVMEGNKEKGKDVAHLMILSSCKVVGNVGARWKEVRDRVQSKEKQAGVMAKIGQEIVPVEKLPSMVPKQVQTANKFALLEFDNSDSNENNKLVLV